MPTPPPIEPIVVETVSRRRDLRNRRAKPIIIIVFALGLFTSLIVVLVVIYVVSAPTVDPWRRAVKAYLETTERRYIIHRVYSPEQIEGALFYCADVRCWLPFSYTLRAAEGFRGEDRGLTGDRADCRAVRVKYETDEGFDRVRFHDRVFLLGEDRIVVGSIPAENFRIAKPGALEEQGKARKRQEDFFNPEKSLGRRAK